MSTKIDWYKQQMYKQTPTAYSCFILDNLPHFWTEGFFYSKMTKTTCVTQCTKNKMSKCEKKKPFVSEMKKDVSIKAHTP